MTASDYWVVNNAELKSLQLSTENDGMVLSLLTPEEFDRLPDGTEIYSIFGVKEIKGDSYINKDTRGGRMAYGLRVEDL